MNSNLNVKCYFITGTGRCGTKLFAKLFSLANNSICDHEKIFRHESMLQSYLNDDFSWYKDDIHSSLLSKIQDQNEIGKSYGISSGHLYFAVSYLYHLLQKNVRFLFLIRKPEEFARSALARGFFDSRHPHPCMQILPKQEDTISRNWDTLSPFEKNLWYWQLVNENIVCQAAKLPPEIFRIVKIEEINPRIIRELCSFLELKGVNDEDITEVLKQRINATPGLGDENDVNPWSLPLTLGPVETWTGYQLSLLDKYCGDLRTRFYGALTLSDARNSSAAGHTKFPKEQRLKKILLIQPWNYHDEGVAEHNLTYEWRNGPYSLISLATQLQRHRIPVEIVDLQPVLVLNRGALASCFQQLYLKLEEFRPDIIGIGFFSYQVIEVKKILDFAKDACSRLGFNPLFLAGGIHCSIEPHQTIERLGFDYAFVGEGEIGIVELGLGVPPEDILGIIGGKSETISRGKFVEELDSLPFPDWSLCNYGFYATPSYKIAGRPIRTLDILMGRGCINRCSFCAYSATGKVRFYTADYLIEQIKTMRRLYGIEGLYFTDSSIGNNPRLLRRFCESMVTCGLAGEIEWYANMRADQVDEEMLRLLWDAGCRCLFYGFESGSQRILDAMHKRCSVEDNYRIARLHNTLRFPYHASMILGYPTETEEDISKSMEFIRQVRPPRVGFNWYIPLPGSNDYRVLKKQNKISIKDPYEWRNVGEVLTTGRVFADVEEKRFRDLFAEATALAGSLFSKDFQHWDGPRQVTSSSTEKILCDSGTKCQLLKKETESEIKMPSDNFELLLREKWREIPATRQERIFSSQMLQWDDAALLEYWEECRRQTTTPEVRGWFQELYRDSFAGCEMADIGPGVGVDGIFFAQQGAKVTFVDIVEDNLKLLERICRLKGVEADYYYIDDFFKYHFPHPFDVFLFVGSLINAPVDFTRRQISALMPFLRSGGKILILGYPRERYENLGAKDGAEFGKMTDGERTPWCEWYDEEKICDLFGDTCELNWSRNFGADDIEFNWFDLTKIREDSFQNKKKGNSCIVDIPDVGTGDLHKALGVEEPLDYPKALAAIPLNRWRMEIGDSPIFRYLYRNFRPRRHLEFGTWQGTGALYCLEECDAAVWTLNVPFGERDSKDEAAYGLYPEERREAREWAEKIGMAENHSYQTDSLGFIGRFYLEKEMGHRVCQIYCDSRKWDISMYPEGFFDSVLIDGGHTKEIVVNDTRKALQLVREGGVILWHDFCPPVRTQFSVVNGVAEAIEEMWDEIRSSTSQLFWIRPSWILLGIKQDKGQNGIETHRKIVSAVSSESGMESVEHSDTLLDSNSHISLRKVYNMLFGRLISLAKKRKT